MESSESIDLLKICRMCLKKERILKSMFHCSVNDVLYADIYEFCTSFKITSVQCTSSICTNCETDLLLVYEFKQKIQENEEKLDKLIQIKNQSDDDSSTEMEKHFLGIDDDFPDYQIDSLDECKFKGLIDVGHVKCTKCMTNCETEEAINSVNLNESIIIVCAECETALSSRENFLQHYTQTHVISETSDKNIICHDKKLKFTQFLDGIGHELSGMVENVDMNENHTTVKCANVIWKCLVCNIRFMREESLKKHFETAHKSSNNDNNNNFGQESHFNESSDFSLKSNKKQCGAKNKIIKSTLCKICGAQFRHRSTKISHMTREHGLNKFLECHFGCGFTTLKKDRFKAHIETHENPNKVFHCPICDQAFKSYNTMTLHRAKHGNSETLLCPFCNKAFLDKRNYNGHISLHTKKVLFECEKCHRGFNRKEHLKNHLNKKGRCDNAESNIL